MTVDPTQIPPATPTAPPAAAASKVQFQVAWDAALDQISAVGARAVADAQQGDRAAEGHDFSDLTGALTTFSTTLTQLPLDAQHALVAPVQAHTDALLTLAEGGAHDPTHADYGRFIDLIEEWMQASRALANGLDDA